MARLQTLQLKIETGRLGTLAPVRVRINGHTLPLTRTAGSTGSQDTWEGYADIHSVVHSLELIGPAGERWQIEQLEAKFIMDQGITYTHELQDLMLEANSALDIWATSDVFSV